MHHMAPIRIQDRAMVGVAGSTKVLFVSFVVSFGTQYPDC